MSYGVPDFPSCCVQVVEVFDAGEGASKFTFHTPFTATGKVHGSTAEQCKKLTELEVRFALRPRFRGSLRREFYCDGEIVVRSC